MKARGEYDPIVSWAVDNSQVDFLEKPQFSEQIKQTAKELGARLVNEALRRGHPPMHGLYGFGLPVLPYESEVLTRPCGIYFHSFTATEAMDPDDVCGITLIARLSEEYADGKRVHNTDVNLMSMFCGSEVLDQCKLHTLTHFSNGLSNHAFHSERSPGALSFFRAVGFDYVSELEQQDV